MTVKNRIAALRETLALATLAVNDIEALERHHRPQDQLRDAQTLLDLAQQLGHHATSLSSHFADAVTLRAQRQELRKDRDLRIAKLS
jgi:hypothetical protein